MKERYRNLLLAFDREKRGGEERAWRWGGTRWVRLPLEDAKLMVLEGAAVHAREDHAAFDSKHFKG